MPKVVLVTGAARRIGAACARMLHAAGYNVVLHFKSSESDAIALCEALNNLRYASAVSVKADLQSVSDVERLAVVATSTWGGLDALVNSASVFYPHPVGKVLEQDWEQICATNLKAPFFLSQALLATLRARRGCIVNIADIHADAGLPGFPVYSIAKAGLLAMTRCLAKDMAPEVRVNAVSPGAILWPEHGGSEVERAAILSKIALGRRGEADDIAKAVKFLIQDAEYITGQTINVEGGRSLYR